MTKLRNRNRRFALLLAALLLFTQIGTTTYAGGNLEGTRGLCEHHREHTDCGYAKAKQGTPCKHGAKHSQECYTDELICGYDEAEAESVTDASLEDEDTNSNQNSTAGHTHTKQCYVLDCPHESGEHWGYDEETDGEHNPAARADCGYSEGVEGQPCGYICEICSEKGSVSDNGIEYGGTVENATGNIGEIHTDKDNKDKNSAAGTNATGSNADKNSADDPSDDSFTPSKTTDPETANQKDMTDIAVTDFDELSEEVRQQNVMAGTALDGLTLPGSLGASGYTVVGEDYLIPEPEAITIEGVTWELTEENNGMFTIWEEETQQGSYIFTPVLPAGYVLSDTAELPEINVLIGLAEPKELNLMATYMPLTIKNSDFTYDNGTLTILTNDGTTKWREEPTIDKADVTNVVIGSSVTVIGSDAFMKCSSLQNVDFSNCTQLTTIDMQAFWECTSLSSLSLPDSVVKISQNAFRDCENLVLNKLPDNLHIIEIQAFMNCTSLVLNKLPDSLTKIHSRAFSGCSGLRSLDLSGCDKLDDMFSDIFENCMNLISLKMPRKAPGIVTATFDSLPNLTIYIPEGSIGYDSGHWKDLKNIKIIKNTPSANNSAGRNSTDDSGGNEFYGISGKFQANAPVPAVIVLPLSEKDGTATGSADDGLTAGAISGAKKEARAGQYGIAVQYDAKTAAAWDSLSFTISRETIKRLTDPDNQVKQLALNTASVNLTFDLASLKEIEAKSTGSITLTANRETGLAGAAMEAAGSRPAYRLAVEYTDSEGQAAAISDFGTGNVTVGLVYNPAVIEQTGGLGLFFTRDGSSVEWLDRSGYDPKSGSITGSAGQLSVFGVGYRPAIAGGWVQNDSGSWLYYEGGKPATGWKLINGKWYFFDTIGLMQAGGQRQIDGKWYYFYPDGAWKEE